jgi:DNA-directed RNA polymerase specialized sigma24 family protein
VRQNHPPAEPATYEDWYAEHAPFVLRLARWFGVPLKEREDVAQEVWCDVHRSLHLYDPAKGSARAWLGGITKNKVRDWKRTRKRRPEFSALLDRVPDLPTTQDEPDAGLGRQLEVLTAFVEHAIPN